MTVDFVGVEGKDVFRDGEKGFNIIVELNAATLQGAKFRAVGSTAMRFPTTITEAEAVSATELGPASVPGTSNYRVKVFVPTEGFADAGVGKPLEFILDVVNDRVVDPITGRLMETFPRRQR